MSVLIQIVLKNVYEGREFNLHHFHQFFSLPENSIERVKQKWPNNKTAILKRETMYMYLAPDLNINLKKL